MHRDVVTRALQTDEQTNELFLQRFAARLQRYIQCEEVQHSAFVL